MPPELCLTAELLKQMIVHIESCLPEEACGLVGGAAGKARLVLPVENDLHSPFRFRMAPLAQLQAFDRIEAHGLELMAIFHSHPQGPTSPSPTDIAEFYYPGTAVLIVSPGGSENEYVHSAQGLAWGNWRINGFDIDHNQFHTVKLDLAA